MKRDILWGALFGLAVGVGLLLCGCTTGTAPTPDTLAAYNRLLLTDYKTVRAIQRTP